MNELSEHARQGTLDAAETAELDSYVHVSNLLAMMQSKARNCFAGREIAQGESSMPLNLPGRQPSGRRPGGGRFVGQEGLFRQDLSAF
jgi:hypothetical protein